MKIIPDPIYKKMKCASERVTTGTPRIVQFAVDRLPVDKLPSNWRLIVGPLILVGPACVVFYESMLMYPVVGAWLYISWRIGTCSDCATESSEQDSESY